VGALMGASSSTSADALYLLTLDQLPGVGPVTVRRLVERFGTAKVALTAPTGAFASVAGAAAARARSDVALRRGVERALHRAERLGVHVSTWNSPEYPDALRHLTDPPPVLFLRGRLELLAHSGTVTVVGARRATGRARDIAERLGVALARSGVVVASGLALGVDGAVHQGVLRGYGDAIGVLGTGPDVVYPRAHRRLFERILDRGLVVSEFLPGTVAAPHHFPRRNRILAALASTIVVVEAGPRSGSLITVDHGLDIGRDVWVVPGPIELSTCAGSNRLLGEGARPLLAIADFVAEVAGEPAPSSGERTRGSGSGPELAILAALAGDTLLADELAARAGLPVATALALLTTMELHGEVERMPGMRFRRAA
jgi:DNA processing protein